MLYNQHRVTLQACFLPPVSWLLGSAESTVTFYNRGNKEDISSAANLLLPPQLKKKKKKSQANTDLVGKYTGIVIRKTLGMPLNTMWEGARLVKKCCGYSWFTKERQLCSSSQPAPHGDKENFSLFNSHCSMIPA